MTNLIRFNGIPAVRWTPFAVTGNPVSDLDRVFDSLASRVLSDPYAGNTAVNSGATELRADVRETANAYIVQFDVPGVAKEDITVDVDDKTVRVEASFKRETGDGETSVISERLTGVLTRAFKLPQSVDAEQAIAKHEHGVLTLTLPKKNVVAQKRLTIN